MKNKLIIVLAFLISLLTLIAATNAVKNRDTGKSEDVGGWFLDNLEKRNRILESKKELNYRKLVNSKRLLKKDITKAWEEKLINRTKSKENLKNRINEIEVRERNGEISGETAGNQIKRIKKAEEIYWKNASEGIERDIKNIDEKIRAVEKEIKDIKDQLDFLIDSNEENKMELKAKEYTEALKKENELLKDKAEAIRNGAKLPFFLM